MEKSKKKRKGKRYRKKIEEIFTQEKKKKNK